MFSFARFWAIILKVHILQIHMWIRKNTFFTPYMHTNRYGISRKMGDTFGWARVNWAKLILTTRQIPWTTLSTILTLNRRHTAPDYYLTGRPRYLDPLQRDLLQ